MVSTVESRRRSGTSSWTRRRTTSDVQRARCQATPCQHKQIERRTTRRDVAEGLAGAVRQLDDAGRFQAPVWRIRFTRGGWRVLSEPAAVYCVHVAGLVYRRDDGASQGDDRTAAPVFR